MRASVIITNYNYGAYLEEAIDSALNQSYPDVEVIVVDDGSTDNSAEIIRAYGSRILSIFQENGGQCACFNTSFVESHGDIIVFLDADDVLFEDAVQLHVDRFQDARVVKSNGYLLVADEKLRPIGGQIPNSLADSGDYLERFLKIGPGAYRSSFTSGNAWSRQFLSKVLPLPLDRSVGADGMLTAIEPLFGRLESIKRPIGKYRLHGCNKGPQNPVYGIEYLKKAVNRYGRRRFFAKSWSQRLGYEIDSALWAAQEPWRLVLARHVLFLTGVEEERVDFRHLVINPLRQSKKNVATRTGLAALLTLAKLLPRRPSLWLAHRILSRSFMKRRSRSAAGLNPGSHETDMYYASD